MNDRGFSEGNFTFTPTFHIISFRECSIFEPPKILSIPHIHLSTVAFEVGKTLKRRPVEVNINNSGGRRGTLFVIITKSRFWNFVPEGPTDLRLSSLLQYSCKSYLKVVKDV